MKPFIILIIIIPARFKGSPNTTDRCRIFHHLTKNISTVLLGITKPEQLEENIGCLSVIENLTSEHMENIEKILDNKPEAYAGFGGAGMRQIVTI